MSYLTLFLFLCLTPSWAQALSVPGAFGPPDLPAENAQIQAQELTQARPLTPVTLTITLPELTAEEHTELATQEEGQPQKVGIGRDIPSVYQGNLEPLMEWTTREDGSLASAISLTSPGADSLRIAVHASLDEGAELRFFSLSHTDENFDPITQQDFRHYTLDSPMWSPVIEGESIGVEVVLPSYSSLSTFSLHISQVSHLDARDIVEPQSLSDVGASECNHVDAQCSANPEFGSGTAKMVFTEGGSSFLCTGTLITEIHGTFIPYFLTAHHCINTRSAASSLVTYWDFERATCGGPDPTSVTQLSGGADLLATDSSSDSTLLMLGRLPPGRRWYMGWHPEILDHSISLYLFHHPAGDLKKDNTGTWSRFSDLTLESLSQEVDAF